MGAVGKAIARAIDRQDQINSSKALWSGGGDGVAPVKQESWMMKTRHVLNEFVFELKGSQSHPTNLYVLTLSVYTPIVNLMSKFNNLPMNVIYGGTYNFTSGDKNRMGNKEVYDMKDWPSLDRMDFIDWMWNDAKNPFAPATPRNDSVTIYKYGYKYKGVKGGNYTIVE